MKYCFLFLFTSVYSTVCAADWPQWRGPDRNGLSSETGLITTWENQQPELVWMTEGMGEGYAGVAVAKGKVYTTGNLKDEGQGVVAVDAKNGKVLWSTVISGKVPGHERSGSRCTPSIDGDHLYAITSDGVIACLTTAGKRVWKKEFKKEWGGKMMSGWGYSESPLVDGDHVLCTPGGKDAMMVCLDKKTGREVWRCRTPDYGDRGNDGAGYASIDISRGGGVKQYVQMTGRGLIGVRAEDGKFLWGYNRIANGTANIPSPVISGNHVFCSTGYRTGAALLELKSKGTGRFEAEEVYFLESGTLQNHHGGMVLVGDNIYCGHKHDNGFPICVEMKTGDVIWGGDKRGPGRGSAAVTYADGHLIFRYQNGTVALIEATPEEYRLKGTFKPEHQEGESWAHPVVAWGHLFLREQDKLMCYSLKP